MKLFSIPLYTSWTVSANGGRLELAYQSRARKVQHRYQDYDLSIGLEEGYQLTLTVIPKIGTPRLLERCVVNSWEELPEKLSLLQAKSAPECWGEEHRSWIKGLWEAEQSRLHTRHIRQIEPPRPPVPVDFVPLKIPAGWTAAWNTFDKDYLQPGCLAAAEDLSRLHWERDIAMFVNEIATGSLCLDLEDWSGEDMRMAAFRVHLYRWTERGPVTLGETMTQEPQQALETLEKFFQWDCEAKQSGL